MNARSITGVNLGGGFWAAFAGSKEDRDQEETGEAGEHVGECVALLGQSKGPAGPDLVQKRRLPVAFRRSCAMLGVLRNGGALVSTVGWSLVLHAGEVCWSPYQPRQNTNANYDEELALAA